MSSTRAAQAPRGHFFDTNVLLYLLSADLAKADRAEALIAEGGTTSVQVLNDRLAWYDALIAASALSAGCRTLCSEDFQNGVLLGGSLRVINPFVASA